MRAPSGEGARGRREEEKRRAKKEEGGRRKGDWIGRGGKGERIYIQYVRNM